MARRPAPERGAAGGDLVLPDGTVVRLSVLPAAARALPRFADFALEYLRTRAAAINKPSALHAKHGILERHLIPRLGALRLDAIGVHEASELQAELLDAGLSRKTVNNVATVLRTILRYAVERELIAREPKVPHLSTRPPEVRALEAPGAARLLTVVEPAWRVA